MDELRGFEAGATLRKAPGMRRIRESSGDFESLHAWTGAQYLVASPTGEFALQR